jgi:hypothetical protein
MEAGTFGTFGCVLSCRGTFSGVDLQRGLGPPVVEKEPVPFSFVLMCLALVSLIMGFAYALNRGWLL